MIELNRIQQAQVRRGELTRTDLEAIVMSNPLGDIVTTCVELLIRFSFDRTPKIVISEEDFNNHFRLVGRSEDGGKETRGRKPKTVEDKEEPQLL